MSRLAILASVVVLAAGSANCANAPGEANSLGDIGPSATMVAASASGEATSSTLARGGGKPPANSGGTISVVLINSTDGVAHFGQDVTFDVHTTATTWPWVTLRCYQSGTLVLQGSNGIFPTSLDQTFTLGPTPLWRSGAANCTATLENWDSYSKNGSITVLASMSFLVSA